MEETGETDIFQSFDSKLLCCEDLTDILRRSGDIDASTEVSDMRVVPGSELRWPQSHSAKLDLVLRAASGPQTMPLRSPHVFPMYLKKALASEMPRGKPLAALQRDLLSNRNEVRFYRELAPLLAERGVPLLRCFLAADNFCDASSAYAGAGEADAGETQGLPLDEAQLRQRGALLLLERADQFFQASPLSEGQAMASLRLLAKFHGEAWQDSDILALASQHLHPTACYWSLSKRGMREMGLMREHWRQYLIAFTPLAPELLRQPGIVELAARIERVAVRVAEELSPGPDCPHATLVHGDYKAMNIFLAAAEQPAVPPDPELGAADEASDGSTSEQGRAVSEGMEAVPIDFQWTGLGYGMSDVAMHLSHSVSTEAFQAIGEAGLVSFYLDELRATLGADAAAAYTDDVAWRHYNLAVVDYARMVLGCFLKGASPEAFAAKANQGNVGLCYRNVEASLLFVERVDRCLKALEDALP